MNGWRKVGSFVVMASFFLMTTATSKPKKTTSNSSGSGGPTVTPTAASVKPADVDVIHVMVSVGCSRTSTKHGCRLLADFDDADTWVDVPVVDAVWYGEMTGIGGTMDEKREFYFLQIGAGGPGSFTGSTQELFPENAKETADATKLLAAVRLGQSVPGSEAATYMKTATPENGKRKLLATRGRSHRLKDTVTYLRKRGSRVLMLEYSGSPIGDPKRPSRVADVWVGELFKLNQ